MTQARRFSRRVRLSVGAGVVALTAMTLIGTVGGAARASSGGVTPQDHVETSTTVEESTTTIEIDPTTTTTAAPTTTTVAPTTTTVASTTTTTDEPTTTTVAPEPTTTSMPGEPTTTTSVAPPGGGYGGDPGTGGTDLTSSAGGSITVHGSNFMPDSDVTVVLHSDPVTLGTATTDDNGAFVATFKLPANTAAGDHQVLLEGTNVAGDPTTVTLSLTVTGSGGSLPLTGSTVGPLAFLAAGLVAIGVVLARRRRAATR